MSSKVSKKAKQTSVEKLSCTSCTFTACLIY